MWRRKITVRFSSGIVRNIVNYIDILEKGDHKLLVYKYYKCVVLKNIM